MTALSDFMENRLLGTSLLGSETYVLPYIINIDAVADSTLYEFYINNTQIDITSGTGPATRSSILTALASEVNSGAGASEPVTATQFTDVDEIEKLKIEGDGSHANFWVGGLTANLSSEQDVYAALFTTATDDTSGGDEVVGGLGYTREKVPFGSPVSGATDNTADVTFGPATSSWGTITHVALYDDFTGGNRLFHGALTSSKTIDTSDSFVFRTSDLDLVLD